MRIAADTRPGAALWHHTEPWLLGVGVWTYQPYTRSEDAEPALVHHRPSHQGILAVFDGSGGAGGAPAHTSSDGTPRSGAWLGARAARAGLESWFRECVEAGGSFDVTELHRRFGELLTGLRPPRRSKVLGTAARELPTTMAAIRYVLNGGSVDCHALWAGDSRAYAFTPRSGLQPLTRDHTVESDGLAQLLEDPPLTNLICADRDFVIEPHDTVLDLPVVLLCATDGFFGYVSTPADFECHLLHTLQYASDGPDWARRLANAVEEYTRDDASLVIVAIGYADFDGLRRSFADRAGEIFGRYHSGRPGADGEPAAIRRWRESAWRDYQPGYEQRMPQLPQEHM
jgi:hypothetical protein